MATVTNKVLFMPLETNWPRFAGGSLLPTPHNLIEPSVQPMSANAPVLAMATDVGASSGDALAVGCYEAAAGALDLRRRRGLARAAHRLGAASRRWWLDPWLLSSRRRRSLAARASQLWLQRGCGGVYAQLHRRAAAAERAWLRLLESFGLCF